uniref:phosphatidylinositol 4,5-bisphosphate 3-kinase catalytic subunit gamma isoform-like n=1 Tax=Myxine glutinosa TaxID=7769 RepID=UPI00358DFB64
MATLDAPKPLPRGLKIVTFDVSLPKGKRFSLGTRSNCTVKVLLEAVWQGGCLRGALPLEGAPNDPRAYTLLLEDRNNNNDVKNTKGGCHVGSSQLLDLGDLEQPLFTLNCVQSCGENSIPVRLSLRKGYYADEFSQREIAMLIGFDPQYLLQSEFQLGDPELIEMRRSLREVCANEIKSRDRLHYAMEPWSAARPLTDHLLSAIPPAGIEITLHWESEKQVLRITSLDSPSSFMQQLFKGAYGQNIFPSHASVEDLVLKVCGRDEYLCGQSPFVDFVWIRYCFRHGEPIHLTLVWLTDLHTEDSDNELVSTSIRYPDVPSKLSPRWRELNIRRDSFTDTEVQCFSELPLWRCKRSLRVRARGARFPEKQVKAMPPCVETWLEAELLHGEEVLGSTKTPVLPIANTVTWDCWMHFSIRMKDIPLGTRLFLRLYTRYPNAGGLTPAYHFGNILLLDHHSLLRQGHLLLHLWPPAQEIKGVKPAGHFSTVSNPDMDGSVALVLHMDEYKRPVTYSSITRSEQSHVTSPSHSKLERCLSKDSVQHQLISELLNSYFLKDLQVEELKLLWDVRQYCSTQCRGLPLLMRSVQWGSYESVQEAYALLAAWPKHGLSLSEAFELLGFRFADCEARNLAVKRFEDEGDEVLLRFLLQLVQALKFEPYHDSALARFLLCRSLKSKRLGHFLFWHLRSEIAISEHHRARFAVLLEAYLHGCGREMCAELKKQCQVVDNLQLVGNKMQSLLCEQRDIPCDGNSRLQDELRKITLPSNFRMPYDPCVRAGKLKLEKSKVMPSKKKPLWLEFENADPTAARPVKMIFKNGDDLRQDMIILQMFNIMDDLWDAASLDLSLFPYGCLSTGSNMGIIEVVDQATTIASIQKERGAILSALRSGTIKDWLDECCPLPEENIAARMRFLSSLAGYSVATYVLGICDRHNDNIMITENGNVFHIDFGHILGNVKKFMGINRDQHFVLTPDFLNIMGVGVERKTTEYFRKFESLCTDAYRELQKHGGLFVSLFSMMLLAGLPEVTEVDLSYLCESLQPTREGEPEHILEIIKHCKNNNWKVQINFLFHNLVGVGVKPQASTSTSDQQKTSS